MLSNIEPLSPSCTLALTLKPHSYPEAEPDPHASPEAEPKRRTISDAEKHCDQSLWHLKIRLRPEGLHLVICSLILS